MAIQMVTTMEDSIATATHLCYVENTSELGNIGNRHHLHPYTITCPLCNIHQQQCAEDEHKASDA